VVIDPGTEKGARADARLRAEVVAWLITVASDGTPLPTPVWFWWDGESILVYSQRDKPKLRHIAANPRVALAMRTDELGDDIVVVTGDAAVDSSAPAADQLPGYVDKYHGLIVRLGSDPAGFAGEYAVPIRIRPTRLRAWQAAGG
jgi:PPOX class probable F420-dependent enzyme